MNKCQSCEAVLPSRIEGQRGRPRQYCNRFCFAIAKGYLKTAVKPEFCLLCGVAIDQRITGGTYKKYCSKKHADKYNYSLRPKVSKIEKVCVYCFQTYLTNRKEGRFCSSDCRTKQLAIETKAKRVQLGAKVYSPNCERCHQLINQDGKKYGRFCRSCALVKRRESHRQKFLKRQQVSNPMRISADVLIERDGNICHLCNVEIDLSLARNSRFGATIDHVIPLSKGGLDVMDNLKLAHWICNIKKGNRVNA